MGTRECHEYVCRVRIRVVVRVVRVRGNEKINGCLNKGNEIEFLK